MAPKDEQENRILGIKYGLDFIADTSNEITEDNLYKLYMMTVGNFLTDEDKLLEHRNALADLLSEELLSLINTDVKTEE